MTVLPEWHAMLPRRALLLAPTGLAVLGGVVLLALRDRLQEQAQLDEGAGTPAAPPSPLLGKPVPAFALPGLGAKPGFATAEISALGRPVLINFFASWCVPCLQEIPVLLRLSRGSLPIWGIDFRDKPDDAAGFLRRDGDPYQRIGRDQAGKAGDGFGLYGLPESFLVDRSGIVRDHWVGGLTDAAVTRSLETLSRGAPS